MTANGDVPDPDVRFEFDHSLAAAGHARRELRRVLTEPDDPIADDVRLATSELVTNVVVHTDHGGELRAWGPRPDVPLRIEVQDDDPRQPVIPEGRPAVGGHGLAIVDSVADRWGVDATPPGKLVWAEFDGRLRVSALDDDDRPERGDPTDA